MPDYLEDIPGDPFSDRPLCYRLEGQRDFILYATGLNGEDNGGVWVPRSRFLTFRHTGDLVISGPRERDEGEWILVRTEAGHRNRGR